MFTESQNYLSSTCKTQIDFKNSLVLLGKRTTFSSLNSINSMPGEPSTASPENTRLMKIWLELFVDAAKNNCNPTPLFILRFIQFIEYGFYKGWSAPKQLNLIEKISSNFKLAKLKDQSFSFVVKDYKGFRRLYKNIAFEISNGFPYCQSTFRKCFQIHIEEFSNIFHKLTFDTLRISVDIFLISRAPVLEAKNRIVKAKVLPEIKSKDLKAVFEKYLIRPVMSEPIPERFLQRLSNKINSITARITTSQAMLYPFEQALNASSNTSPVKLVTNENFTYDCLVHNFKNKAKIHLYMTHIVLQFPERIKDGTYKPHLNLPLGVGTEKSVWRSQKFSIFLNDNDALRIHYSRMVRMIPTYTLDQSLITEYLTCNKLQKTISDNPNNLPLVPRLLFNTTKPYQNFQIYEEWVNSTFSYVFNNMNIAEDFLPNSPTKPVSIFKFFPLVVETAKMLGKLHNIGLVHLDIKPKNLMIRFKKNGELQIVPIDFTRCRKFSIDFDWSDPECNYIYWDTLRKQKGLEVPYTDNYGLVITTAELLIPNFDEIVEAGIYSLTNIDQYKFNAFRDFIEGYSEYLRELKIDPKQPMKICSKIEIYLKENKQLPPQEHENLSEIAYRAKALGFVLELLFETLQAEKNVVENYSKLESYTKKVLIDGSFEDKAIYLNKISMGPILTKNLIGRLEKICQTLDAYNLFLISLN